MKVDRQKARVETGIGGPAWRRGESGQAIIIVALCMVVLIGITGLAIDGGRILAVRRDLVQMVDAAALAGANALSGPPVGNDATHQARALERVNEYARLNGFDTSLPGYSLSVTFPTTTPARKLVQVAATRPVDTVFMQVLGINRVTVNSDSRQGEAAPLDIVILQDVSVSQLIWNYSMGDTSCLVDPTYTGSRDPASDIPSTRLACSYPYDPTRPTTTLTYTQWQAAKQHTFQPNIPWLPFARQQWAARYFVNNLDSRYDQVAVVSFSSSARVNQPLTNQFSLALNAIGQSPETVGQTGSRGLEPGGGTNIAQGISAAMNVLTSFAPSGNARDTAVGAIILLTDGSTTTRLGRTSPGSCSSYNLDCQDCVNARSDVIAQAQLAAQSGIVIYTIFVGNNTWERDNALMAQYVADLTDNRRLDGNYSGSRNLPVGYGPAFTQAELSGVTNNYYHVDPNNPAELQAAYDAILSKIYTRLVR
jgi:hypothetical protein